MLDRCEICEEFIYDFEEHKCKPLWLCSIGDDNEDFCYKSYAYSEESAAEQCVEEQESNWDYCFVDDGGVDVDVKNPETGEIKKFYVSAESFISYSASEKDNI